MEFGEEGDPDIEACSIIVPMLDRGPGTTNITVEDRDRGITYNRSYQIYPFKKLYSIDL
jgi:hypothetical protein